MGNFTICTIDRVDTLIIKEGVEIVGNRGFSNIKSFKRVIFPNSLIIIGDESFEGCDLIDLEMSIGIKKVYYTMSLT